MFEWLKAWWRGEKRVAPRGVRGRVYARKGGGPMEVKARSKAAISMKVYRAKTDTWEEV